MYYTEYADGCQYNAKKLMKTIINIDFMIYFKGKKYLKILLVDVLFLRRPGKAGARREKAF